MSIEINDYLTWYIPKLSSPKDVINLHSSGMPPVKAEALNPPSPGGFEMLGLVEKKLAGNLNISEEEVIFTSGATGGTLLTLLTLGKKQGNFVVETPIYEPMMRQAERLGNVRRLPRTFADSWQIDPTRAADMIDSQTSVVLITEPHNPSGLFSSRESVETLADICRAKGAYLLINEVYRGYTERESLHNLADNVLVTSSYSKLLGAYSNRVGWVSGKPDVIERLRRASLNTGSGSVPSAAVGIAFAEEAEQRAQRAKAAAAKWVNDVDEWVGGYPDIDWIPPEGPGFGAVVLPRYVDDLIFVNRLYKEKNVLAVPGSLFLSPGTMRISWLGVGERLYEGLDIIAEALKKESVRH